MSPKKQIVKSPLGGGCPQTSSRSFRRPSAPSFCSFLISTPGAAGLLVESGSHQRHKRLGGDQETAPVTMLLARLNPAQGASFCPPSGAPVSTPNLPQRPVSLLEKTMYACECAAELKIIAAPGARIYR